MSRMTTRIGPVIVSHTILKNGDESTTINDTKDDELFMVFPNWPMLEGIKWAIDYVEERYTSRR